MKKTIKSINTANEFIRLIQENKSDADMNDFPKIKELISENKHFGKLQQNLTNKDTYRLSYDQKQEDIDHLLQTIRDKKRRITLRNRLIRLSVSIASAVAVVSFLLFYPSKENVDVEKYTVLETLPKSIYDTPTLLLSNGTNIDIANEHNEIIADGATIIKNGNNIIYSTTKNKDRIEATPIGKVVYNTLIIPKMCSFSIVLDDGTEVVLNANSELKYPTKFTEETRSVYLKGEAYFKVKKGSKPFIVNCSDMKIKVYGTEFNVRANNSTEVSAVLVEGSIGAQFKKSNGEDREVIIKPNEILTVDFTDENISIKDIDPQSYTAWMDGYFRHDSNKLKSLLEELSMWYGIHFYTENEQCKNLIITCSFDKGAKLDSILNSLQKITGLTFEKKGDDYIVK